MKSERLSAKKITAIAICGALIIGAIGLSLVHSQASSAQRGIDTDKATAIALENAGFEQGEVLNLMSRYDYEDGLKVYEVDFYANDFEYDYLIAASDGIILEAKREMMDSEDYREAGLTNLTNPATANEAQSQQPSTQTQPPAQSQQTAQTPEYIGTEKAKSIALSHAGVAAGDATFTKAKLDRDDGVYIYEIEFFSGVMEYDYEINATTGKVTDYDADHIDD